MLPPSKSLSLSAVVAAAVGFASLNAPALRAQFYIGPNNGTWFDADNWDGGIPTPGSSPTIDGLLTAVISAPGVSVDTLLLGSSNGGSLRVDSDASGSSNSVQLGGESRLTVTGENSAWTTHQFSVDGFGDTDHLIVSNGGHVTVDSLSTGSWTGVGGNILVTGSGSQLVDTSDPSYWGLTLGSNPGGSGSLTINDGGTVTSSGTVALGYSGTGDVLLTGAGSSWTVNNSVYFGYGETGIGSLTVADGATGSSTGLSFGYYGSNGTGALTITGSGSRWSSDSLELLKGTITLEDGGVLRLGDGTGYGIANATTQIGNGTTAGRIEGGWLNYGALALNHTDTAVVVTGYFTNFGTIEKNGTGTSIFAGEFTNSGGIGAVAINAGTFQLGNGGELSDIDGEFTTAAGGTLAFNSSSNLWFSGLLSGEGSLRKSGTGRLTLDTDNTYTGSTTVDGGTLSISSDTQLGTAPSSATASHLVLDGGTLRTTATMTLNANRGVELGAAGGTFQTTGTLTYAGIIAGDGGLTKTGNGTLVLTGDNLYSGDTAITRGTVRIGNTSGSTFGSGDVTVSTNGTLTGSGSFTGALTNNGTFSPGDDFSLLTISNFTQSATGTLILQLGGLTRGFDYDALDITGTLSAGGTLQVLFANDFNPTSGASFNLLDWTTLNGWFATVDFPSLGEGLSWNDSAFATTGILTIAGGSAIPEPSTYAALAGALALGLAASRRRRRARAAL